MSSDSVYANFEPIESSLNGTVTLTLKRKSRQIVITNDSGSANLQYKFNSSEDFGTLKPTETIRMEVWVRNILLSTSTSVPYRIWVYG